MLYDGNSATQIEKNIGVHTSTITREIKNNKANGLIQKGQSPRVVWQNHPDEFPVGWRAYYGYAHDEKREEICPMDFPRMKRYKPRKNSKSNKKETKTKIGRTVHEYSDFLKLPLEDMVRAAEVDTVVGRRDIDVKCILTIHFNSIVFQFHILLIAHDSKHVNSYRCPIAGQIPLLLAKIIIPKSLLYNLGIELIEPDEVVLIPSLLPHTQIPIN